MIIIALEGLAGVGKTTLAPLVARELGAEQLDAIPKNMDWHRRIADASQNPTYRHLFYLWALATSCRQALNKDEASDKLWVVESYVGRTTAYHAGMGSTLSVDLWNIVPRPALSILVTCDEQVRLERIARRPRPSYWRGLSEEVIEEIRDVYEPFADIEISNDRSDAETTAKCIAGIVTSLMPDRNSSSFSVE